MYEQHFSFQSMPFSADPAEWQFFDSESSAAVVPRVLHTLRSGTGVAVVTGPDGVGKTVLMQHLQVMLARQGQAITLPGTSLQSTDDLYLSIRRGLKTPDGQPVTGGTTRWEIVERLQSSAEFWGTIGLLVDDAHLLTPEIFTEFQFLMEQRASSQPLCRVLLTGSHALEETLAQPAMSGFAQRIRTYTFLQPLRLNESVEYLKTRLSHAGGALSDCFSADAIEAVVEAADGSPRCLNLLADEALLVAFRSGDPRVTLQTVRSALGELQHLPHAWNISCSDSTESALDDTAPAHAGWQSSADGVIEIGAGPSSGAVGPEPHPPEQFPVIVDSLESHDLSDGLSVDVADEADELPILDDIASDGWLDDLSETVPLAPLDDDLPADPEPLDQSNTFDPGDFVADLESVGDPAVEIDESLDQRLLRVADAAADVESSQADDPAPASCDFLPNFRLWQPAGRWDPAESVIRHGAQLDTTGHHTQKHPAGAPDSHSEPANVQVYEISIPAADEPLPVWPPQTSGFGAVSRIPLTDSTKPTVIDSVSDVGAEPSVLPDVFAETAETELQEQETADRDREWSDGQLLHDLATRDDAAPEEETESSPPEDKSDAVLLRLAALTDDAADMPMSADDTTDETTPVPGQMFTLPIALNDVTGECAPLANSVRELQEELASFQSLQDSSSLPTGGATQTTASTEPSEPTDPATSKTRVEVVNENAVDAPVKLIRPRLIGQARQMLSGAAPARQLRQAAGAENSVFHETAGPVLSVLRTDDPAEILPEGSTDAGGAADGFRNLFTRMRKRQQQSR